jgi:hypothetical protein
MENAAEKRGKRETKKARNQANWFRAFLAGANRDAFVSID